MFGKKMSIKDRQETVISQIFQACYDEWQDGLSDDLNDIIQDIVLCKNQNAMRGLFGERFVKLAHLYVDAKKLLTEIEELDNE
jgi:hypothetical protein|tara:strand:+ start:3500 stop:3748 length:249 start_codon:yes stop_codon:yes gene_type:complete